MATILTERKKDKMIFREYESAIWFLDSVKKFNWIYNFRLPESFSMYKMAFLNYTKDEPDYNIFTKDDGWKFEERKRFLKSPLYICLSENEKIFGTVWRENVEKKSVQLHISKNIDYLGMKSDNMDLLFDFFKECNNGSIEEIIIAWSNKLENNNPIKFLERNNFNIYGNYKEGKANLRLSGKY